MPKEAGSGQPAGFHCPFGIFTRSLKVGLFTDKTNDCFLPCVCNQTNMTTERQECHKMLVAYASLLHCMIVQGEGQDKMFSLL